MKTLVTGGAGFIGCHMVKQLLDHGGQVLALDDLSNSHRASVSGWAFATY